MQEITLFVLQLLISVDFIFLLWAFWFNLQIVRITNHVIFCKACNIPQRFKKCSFTVILKLTHGFKTILSESNYFFCLILFFSLCIMLFLVIWQYILISFCAHSALNSFIEILYESEVNHKPFQIEDPVELGKREIKRTQKELQMLVYRIRDKVLK